MKTLFCGLIMVIVGNVSAQKPPVKFGDIPLEDLQMSRYDKDSSAAAVVLADYGESALVYSKSDGFTLNFERITRIKILTKDGLDWATFAISLYNDGGNNEKVSGLKAVTYNLEDNKVVETKLKNDGIFKEKVSENWDVTKVTLPAVKEGSIVEITYKVKSDFIFNFQDWEFQYTIPVRWSEYRATIPEFYGYDKYMQGYLFLAVSDTKDVPASIVLTSTERASFGSRGATTTQFNSDKIDFMESKSRWVAQDVPAFKEEPFITTSKDYISKINFELAYRKFPGEPIKNYMGSWADINKLLSDNPNLGGEITGNNYLKKIVEEITSGIPTAEQKIVAINTYVKNNVAWNGISQKYTDTSLKKVLDDKKGSSSEINLLMASMLEKAGLQVYPVLVSTRDHGFVREATPISSQFNYVLCMVKNDDKVILLDATDKLLPTGILPERCLNGRGFVVTRNGTQSWVDLQPLNKSKAFYSMDLALNSTGQLKGKVLADRSGYYAHAKRKSFLAKGEQEYVKEFVAGRSWTIAKSEFTNAKDVAEPFKEAHEIVIDDHITTAGNMMYLNPLLVLQKEENPFKLEKREYPVDFGSPSEELVICKITIPDGYAIDELPKSVVLRLPENAAKYVYSMAAVGNTITLTSNLQINHSLFVQDEYPHLREFYNMVVAKQAEQVVLKKK